MGLFQARSSALPESWGLIDDSDWSSDNYQLRGFVAGGLAVDINWKSQPIQCDGLRVS